MTEVWARIYLAFKKHGNERYMISEPITQEQHALQTYMKMKQTKEGAKRANLRVAALLHDIGHLLEQPKDPAEGTNDNHEILGATWLMDKGFPPSVTIPIRHHVNAKRYLCFMNSDYESKLTEGSSLSLNLQGGSMDQEEAKLFERSPYFRDALLLRQCDEGGKDVALTQLPDLLSLREEVLKVLSGDSCPLE